MNPSLLLIPDRYKASKLYSQIPDSGAGDLAFTRANDTATRVNSAGLIEKVRTNLVLRSEEFDNAYWSKATAGTATLTVTPNSAVAPDGTMSADLITITRSSTADISAIFRVTSTGTGTFKGSIYLKAKTLSDVGKTIDVWSWEGATSGYTKVTLTADWVRYEQNTTVFTGTGSELFDFGLLPASFSTSTTLNVEFYAWGAQSEAGDIATPYIPTTTAAVSVGPVANIPRIDYTGGGCGKLLLEPQRTNLVTFSEQFNNAAWGASAGGFVRTANATIAPDGTMSADRIQFPTVDTFLIQNTSLTAGTACAGSVYVKGTAGQTFSIAPGGIDRAPFTLNGEWQRITHTATAATDFILLGPINGSNATDVFLWGAQLEAGSYVSSYIPTLGASVTRSADAASKTGISSLIGQFEGSIYAEFTINSVANTGSYDSILNIATDANNSIDVLKNNTTAELYVFAIVGGVIQVNSVGIAGTNILGRHKLALAYKLNDYVCYLDGVQVFTDTSATVPACSNLYVGQYLAGTGQMGGTISSAATYTTRLSNSELASLTTL